MSPASRRQRFGSTCQHDPTVSMIMALGCGLVALAAMSGAVPAGAESSTHALTPRERIESSLPLERPDDPPGIPAHVESSARTAATVTFGRFTHRQVNLGAGGANVVGDAANEPSIAVDPTNHNNMVIGWRQFDTINSNFRQAGYGYTTNGGLNWTAGKIEPGVFRSDPVLGFDAAGRFFYNSLSTPGGTIVSQVFPSTSGGASWGASTFSYGGDKQWMTIDRTGGLGQNHVYQAWSTAGNSYYPNTFNRSNDDATTFEPPLTISDSLVWGTLDVDASGKLYIVGTDGPGGLTLVASSTDARNAALTPSFSLASPDLGGSLLTGPPNPAGLLGQLWIAVDRSSGPRAGWVYVLASVQTPTDPLDVNFTRSTDGGATWSPPVRVNDDPPGNRAWQWFGTMSVSPSGRIDVVWNDSRLSGDSTKTALFYSYSTNGGTTWSANEQASPLWNASVGYPNQAKIGDYYHMISDDSGADLAWAATFNNEEDVYYLRIPNSVTEVADAPARASRLHPGTPNPFSSGTAIRFDVPAAGAHVRLDVFDPAGHRVATLADGFMSGGPQLARWAGTDAAGHPATSGMYFCRYEVDGALETQKLLLIR